VESNFVHIVMVTTLKSRETRCEHLHIWIEWLLIFAFESLSCSFFLSFFISFSFYFFLHGVTCQCSPQPCHFQDLQYLYIDI